MHNICKGAYVAIFLPKCENCKIVLPFFCAKSDELAAKGNISSSWITAWCQNRPHVTENTPQKDISVKQKFKNRAISHPKEISQMSRRDKKKEYCLGKMIMTLWLASILETIFGIFALGTVIFFSPVVLTRLQIIWRLSKKFKQAYLRVSTLIQRVQKMKKKSYYKIKLFSLKTLKIVSRKKGLEFSLQKM